MSSAVTKRIVQLSRRIDQQKEQMRYRGFFRRCRITRVDTAKLHELKNEFEMLAGFKHDSLPPL